MEFWGQTPESFIDQKFLILILNNFWANKFLTLNSAQARGVASGWSLGAQASPRDQNSIQIFKFF